MKKILYVASTPAMSSFTSGFLKAVTDVTKVESYVIIFQDSGAETLKEINKETYNISHLPDENVFFLEYHKKSSIKYFNFFHYCLFIREICKKNKISALHFLTQDVLLAAGLRLFKNFLVYYTVHDLTPHESKLSFIGKLKRNLLLDWPDKYLIRKISCLITCSQYQFSELKLKYPNKKVFFHNMPSLVTLKNIKGEEIQPLKNSVKNYVLFFGRIETYKGLDVLYDAFNNQYCKAKDLVIAGRGQIYFDISTKEPNKNIHFINRFILDEELNCLFRNANLVVLPYNSATQSAVTSLVYFFRKPLIVSNAEGLIDTVEENKSSLVFETRNASELVDKINLLIEDEVLRCNMIKEQGIFYEKYYNERSLTQQLESIFL